MKKTHCILLRRVIISVVLLWLPLFIADAATVKLACNGKNTIGNAVKKLKPGDTIVVSGTCNESVEITEDVSRITLDGQGKATIIGPDKNTPAISVLGRGITIKGFTIRGGRRGIVISGGGTALVDGNTVENAAGDNGIQLARSGVARIINNTIRNNPSNGIQVAGNSQAFIGFVSTSDTALRANTIQGNGAAGINVGRASSARINGNTISDNKRAGVTIQSGASVDIGGNSISGNGGDGIFVAGNSTVTLGRTTGNGLFELPNRSDAPNTGFGIRCSMNSSAEGRLGTLNGSKGTKEFDASCVDTLIAAPGV
jgi:parallel beta-helix repeat protein